MKLRISKVRVVDILDNVKQICFASWTTAQGLGGKQQMERNPVAISCF